jgi:hypothetical protein
MSLTIFNHLSTESKRLETVKMEIPRKLTYPNEAVGFYLMTNDFGFQLHSENDLPALYVISPQGDTWTDWYCEGKHHRDNDKPASIHFNQETHVFSYTWFKNGEKYRDNDQPIYVKSDGYQVWFKNNNYHRDNDKPAVIWNYGQVKEWFKNGELHRDNDKPAIIHENYGKDDYKEWWINGKFIKRNKLQ